MKKLSLILAVISTGLAAQGQLVDDFATDLSAYSVTRILNNGSHTPGNTYSWEISSGALRINTTTYI